MSDDSKLEDGDKESWKALWISLCDAHYSAFYEELCVAWSLTFWNRFGAISEFLQVVTSTSAIGSWAAWQISGRFSLLCGILTGLTALMAIVHKVLKISGKMKDDAIIYTNFKKVRLELGRLKTKMEICAYEHLKDYKDEYVEILERFETASSLALPDWLFTERSQKVLQTKLNRSLGYEA